MCLGDPNPKHTNPKRKPKPNTQMDGTNIRFSQTEIAWLSPSFGTHSVYLVNPLAVYADKDENAAVARALHSEEAMASLDTKWHHLTVDGKKLLPVFKGLVVDTKCLWTMLGRVNDKGWTKPLGGSFCQRAMFSQVNDDGLTNYFGAITFTAKMLKTLKKHYLLIKAKDVRKSYAKFVKNEMGIDVTAEIIFPDAGFDNSKVGPLHLVGTAAQNLMIDIAKIFDAAGPAAMNVFWKLIRNTSSDVGLKAKTASTTRTVRNFRAVSSTGKWVHWSVKKAERFLLYKHPDLMTVFDNK